ncbi:unnamed protein product [Didymodactylos carnosus]|uniref:Uncharacterized protein n=1 Tax=Didymodactylos carnosus TaxID=1234261 RepID=A0A8S2EX56_9BILA|nr:unnamed protein product [Didymodactylos carnosus]CAF4088561.1 unnamed protein product [Didymodactylos carnosus]
MNKGKNVYTTVEHWRYLTGESLASTYFGYSLAIQSNLERPSLIVGSPREHIYNDDYYYSIRRRGAVYECALGTQDCRRLQFPLFGNEVIRLKTSTDNKTDQWFGASVAADRRNIIVGAPHLKHAISDATAENGIHYDIPGTCWKGKNMWSSITANSTRIYSPDLRDFHKEGYGLFGFQVALSKKPERIVITAPGSYYFRESTHAFPSPHYPFLNVNWLKYPKNYSFNEYDDWCYRGYALALGNFNDDDDQEIVTSIPRLNGYQGAIEILSSNLNESSIQSINGSQVGAYFGASLCVMDVNNDGLDDLLVGAPLYTIRKDGRILSDAGRVKVYYQNKQHELILGTPLDGTKKGGRFGHAIAKLGDINKDGYEDVAISAPFADGGQSGEVYIYHGSKTGLSIIPAQILKPDKLLRAFGWALQSQFDDDQNGYPDLAISSAKNDTVVIVRCVSMDFLIKILVTYLN